MDEARREGIVASKTDPSVIIVQPLSEWFPEELDKDLKREKKYKKD